MQFFSELLKNQFACRVMAAGAVTHLGLVSMGLPGWSCPIREGLGIPCPGCGVTRALMALARGNWQQAVTIHAFAPVIAVGICLILLRAILPKRQGTTLVSTLAKLEKATQFSWFLAGGMVIYWLIRLIFFNSALYRLVI